MIEIEIEKRNIIEEIINSINRNYLEIRDQYILEYDFPELDPIRYEICKCILTGCFQASITLTNHLVENSLKTFLIYWDIIPQKLKGNEIYSKMNEGFTKYDGKDLEATINNACSKGLIDKDQKKILHDYRVKYRNAFSHAEKRKIFKGEKTSVDTLGLRNGKIVKTESFEIEKSNILFFQGLFQAIKAENESIPYFLQVDKIVRSMLDKLDELKKTCT